MNKKITKIKIQKHLSQKRSHAFLTSKRYSKKLFGGASGQTAVLDVVLLGESFDVFNGRCEPDGCEKGSEIGRVRRDHYESEKPPGTHHDACTTRFRVEIDS